MRVSLTKNDRHIFNKFIRNYKSALHSLALQSHGITKQLISNSQLKTILQFIGYLDQYVTDHNEELIKTISYMLSEKKDSMVTKKNLFEFMRVISDIKKFDIDDFEVQTKSLSNQIQTTESFPLLPIRIGHFDQKGNWTLNQEEQIQVKKMFGSMNLKRISRQNIEAQKKPNENVLQETFKPNILDKSRAMAQQRKCKLSHSRESKVEDRLLQNHSLQKSKLQEETHKSIEKQMSECYFRPKINSNKKSTTISNSLCNYIDSLNTSFENKQNDKSVSNFISHQVSTQSISKSKINLIGDKLLIKGKQYQQHIGQLREQHKQLNQFFMQKQCTFKPKICLKEHTNYRNSSQIIKNKKVSRVKNADKSIDRVKQARKKRQFENAVKQRGYPQNLAWTNFMNSYKKEHSNQNKSPILCIDLKIMNQTKNIKVYEGQSIEEISKKICIQNSIPHQFWNKVETLIGSSIDQCNQVKVRESKVYLS